MAHMRTPARAHAHARTHPHTHTRSRPRSPLATVAAGRSITELIRPDPKEDPPEMEFYRLRPFYVGDTGRLAGHATQYAPSPAEMNNISNYGYWGPYCANASAPGGFNMCHKGHGYGKMHGPHMMEEWWVGGAAQKGPEDLHGWARSVTFFSSLLFLSLLFSFRLVFLFSFSCSSSYFLFCH